MMSNFTAQRVALIEYMRVKMDAEDWHAVMDAAADLREIDAEKRGQRDMDDYYTKFISDNHNARMAGVKIDEPECNRVAG